jgi:hypothetical protein
LDAKFYGNDGSIRDSFTIQKWLLYSFYFL